MSSFAYYLSSPLIYEFNYPSFPSITGPHKSCFHSHLYPSSIPMAPPCFTVHAPTGKKATCKLIDGVVSLLVRKHREHVTLKVFCYLYALIQVSFNQIQSLVYKFLILKVSSTDTVIKLKPWIYFPSILLSMRNKILHTIKYEFYDLLLKITLKNVLLVVK